MKALQPLIASLPPSYRVEMGENIEESLKANAALVQIFPVMIAAMLIVIILQAAEMVLVGDGSSTNSSTAA